MQELALHYLKQNTQLNGRYIIMDVLGEGGFGITYFARDALFDRYVAIKEFFPHNIVTRNHALGDTVTLTSVEYKANYADGKQDFLGEAKTLAQFGRDSGIVHVLDFFLANNTAYIVMEYLEGINLKDYMKKNGLFTAAEMAELMRPVIQALEEVHSQGLIHRDVSPDNIMLVVKGGVKLMDFGTARKYTEYGNKSLSIILKHGYAPPEQYQSHSPQGPWTDIYALCATMYKCITGKKPDNSIERMMEDRLKPPSQLGVPISPSMERALMKGLRLLPKDRYQNLGDFSKDFYGDFNQKPPNKKAGTVAKDAPKPEAKPADAARGNQPNPQGRVNSQNPREAAKSPPGKEKEGAKGGILKAIVLIAIPILILVGISSYSKQQEREQLQQAMASRMDTDDFWMSDLDIYDDDAKQACEIYVSLPELASRVQVQLQNANKKTLQTVTYDDSGTETFSGHVKEQKIYYYRARAYYEGQDTEGWGKWSYRRAFSTIGADISRNNDLCIIWVSGPKVTGVKKYQVFMRANQEDEYKSIGYLWPGDEMKLSAFDGKSLSSYHFTEEKPYNIKIKPYLNSGKVDDYFCYTQWWFD